MSKTLLFLLISISVGTLNAQFQPRRIVSFKNGLSFIHERGTFPTVDGRTVSNLPFPNAQPGEEYDEDLLYTITAGSERVGSRAADIVRFWTSQDTNVRTDRIEYQRQLSHLSLPANIGAELTIILKDQATFTGKLEYAGDGVLDLRNGNMVTSFGFGEIRSITSTEPLVTEKTESDEFVFRTFNVELAEPVGSTTELELFYLASGFNWTPVYNVVLQADNQLSLTLDAQIVNGQKDYHKVELQLGIGQPEFKYASGRSTVFSTESAGALAGWNFENNNGNTLNMSNTFSQSMRRPRTVNIRKSTMGDGGLYFYRIPDFSLGRNQTANYRLLTLETTYRDEYAVQLNTEAEGSPAVDHNIVFTNKGTEPLTTGMAFITDADQRAVGQSKMDFAPEAATTSLRVSGATEIVVTQVSETTKMEGKRKGTYYAYQTSFVVTIDNFKDKAIDLRLRRNVKGEVTESSVAASITDSKYAQDVNPLTNTYLWNLNIPAGGTKTLTFTFEFWGR